MRAVRAAEAPRLSARATRRKRAAAERRAEAAGAVPTAPQTERQAKPQPVRAPATPGARAAEAAPRPGARAAPLGRPQPAPAAEAAPRPGAMRCSADWLRSWRTRRLGQPKQNHRRGRSGVPRNPSQVPTSRRPDLTLGRTPRHAPGADRVTLRPCTAPPSIGLRRPRIRGAKGTRWYINLQRHFRPHSSAPAQRSPVAQSRPVAVTFAVAWGYSSAGRAPAWHAATAERSTFEPVLRVSGERFWPSFRLSSSLTRR
jgi:hypothetical protein